MTPKMRTALVIIERCLAVNGIAPSLQELGTALGGQSRGNAHRIVQALIDRGMLKREGALQPGRQRDMQLTPQGEAALRSQTLARISTDALLAELQRRQSEARP